MITGKKLQNASNFNLCIDGVNIKKTDNVKYLGVTLDEKLRWDHHISNFKKSLSKTCGIAYKLRHFVPLSVLKIIYFSLFQSKIQYSVLNWGRATPTLLSPIQVMQNKYIKASLFLPQQTATNSLYEKFNVLKLSDIIKLECACFMYKFINKMLPKEFENYYTNLKDIHQHNTRQKKTQELYLPQCKSNTDKIMLQYLGVKVWSEIPLLIKDSSPRCFKAKLKRFFANQYST